MTKFLLRRSLGAIVVMWAVATLVFFMLRIVPGDPIAAMLFDVGGAEDQRVRETEGSSTYGEIMPSALDELIDALSSVSL